MRVLVTWGSKRGGTEGIGRIIADALESRGVVVVAVPVGSAPALDGFDAAIVGGALYANRWPSSVRRFVNRRAAALRRIPVWFFSSGPLDDSARDYEIPPTAQVATLAERVGALGHATFGGRLQPGAKGFPASAMAKEHSGDWRNPDEIRAWTARIAAALPDAKPGRAIEHEGHALSRVWVHALAGWTASAVVLVALAPLAGAAVALVLRTILAPGVFTMLAWHYFRARGARESLPIAFEWTMVTVALDLVVFTAAVPGSAGMYVLILLAVWGTGEIMSMRPAEVRRT